MSVTARRTLTTGAGLMLLGALGGLGACGGGESRDAVARGGDSAAPAQAPGATSTPAAQSPAPATPAAGAGPSSPQMVALGDSIFHGQVAGGTCQACHGPDAKGTPLAPNLTDTQWLNGDGSYQFIVTTVTNGVPRPDHYPGPMPPMGGAQLTPDQVRAVAAYVYSLSQRGS